MAMWRWGGCEIRVINNKYAGPTWKDLKYENSKPQYGSHFV